MAERPGAVTFKGSPLTLVGNEVKVGDKAPEFRVVANDMSEVRLADSAGGIRVILSVPSLDTAVCDVETRRFNKEAAALGKEVAILVISMDLPFAQARWCGAAGVKAVRTLSDHRDASFGQAYGLLIKELRLLGRAVLVIDKAGKVAYMQLVKEMSQELDYDAALKAVARLKGR